MLELMLCSMLTLLPDFLIRRFVQGKRLGKEITLFSVWYELRWGITLCLILTVLLITVVLYNHPASKDVNALFRTISIFAETGGRVSEVYVGYNQKVKKGQPLFKIDSKRQEAEIETARARVVEVEAGKATAKADVLTSQGKVDEAKANLQQAKEELDVKTELQRRNPGIVPQRDIEKLQVLVDQRQAGVDAASATKEAAESRLSIVLPAPVTRAAGILIPEAAGEGRLFGGFNQIEAQVIKVGMIAEATCISKPMTIIPLVVASVQDVIAAGQILQTNQLTDMAKLGAPGTVLVFLEPLYEGVLDDVPPGSSCIANLYSNNPEELESKDISSLEKVYLHIVDTVALIHALVLRLQAVVLPLKALVFGGH